MSYEDFLNDIENKKEDLNNRIEKIMENEAMLIEYYNKVDEYEKRLDDLPLSDDYYKQCKDFCKNTKSYCISTIYTCNKSKFLLGQRYIKLEATRINTNYSLLKDIRIKRGFINTKYIVFGVLCGTAIFDGYRVINSINDYGITHLLITLTLASILASGIKVSLDNDTPRKNKLNELELKIKKNLIK